MITYKQQFDKLTEAYFNNEVHPYDDCVCFVGNLLNNNGDWSYFRDFNLIRNTGIDLKSLIQPANPGVSLQDILNNEAEGFYYFEEILGLEREFLTTYESITGVQEPALVISHIKIDEEALFQAFSKTLDMLYMIHVAKGENVPERIPFAKRGLVSAEAVLETEEMVEA
jgi:hypothetical protein